MNDVVLDDPRTSWRRHLKSYWVGKVDEVTGMAARGSWVKYDHTLYPDGIDPYKDQKDPYDPDTINRLFNRNDPWALPSSPVRRFRYAEL